MLETTPASGVDARTRAQREPKYWGLKRHLLDLLRALPPGSPIPTERSLAAEFDVEARDLVERRAQLERERPHAKGAAGFDRTGGELDGAVHVAHPTRPH